MVGVGVLVQPLINLLRDQLLGHDYLQMDDDCMDAGGRAPTVGALGDARLQGWRR